MKPSGQTQFFPWLQSAPNGRVDLAYYDRSCDPGDVLICVTLSSSTDSGASWTSTAVTTTGFDGDTFGACLAFVDPPNCTNFFLGDYIAVASTNTKAQVMWAGNGAAHAQRFHREDRVLTRQAGAAGSYAPAASAGQQQSPPPHSGQSHARIASPPLGCYIDIYQ